MENQATTRFQHVNIEEIVPNKDNPRIIRDLDYKKLVESIRSFPQMLELRPIVLNNETEKMILGGNQRYRACIDAGMKTIPVLFADDLSEDQQREFIIKDNSSAGEWDWDALNESWNHDLLQDWGLDISKILPPAEHKDIGEDMNIRYIVEIDCSSEENQKHVYESLLEKGYKCKILTL